jgi:phosphotransferase system HPr-like phosphotransfer protein
MTIEEQERAAYTAGDTALAAALAQVIDLANEACELRATAADDADAIAHLKRIIADALNDDAWRERAAAAIE